MAVARVTEIIASSPDGFREAVEEGVARAAATLRNLTGLEVTGKRHPQVGVDGKFSVFHCVAVAFIDKKVEEAQFTDARVRDAAVVALSDRVEATVDAAMPADAVYMDLTLRDGRKITKRVEHARGSLKRPLSEAELERKFRNLCEGILPGAQVDRLVAQCRTLAELPDVADIARLAAAA